MREQAHALWATVCCFILGTIAGIILLWGDTRPFTGGGSVLLPAALIAASITAAAFLISTLFYRRGETRPMPRWQAAVSNISAISVTIAMGGVAGLGVLLTGQVLTTGLQGLEFGQLGGGLFTGVAAAFGGRLAFQAGVQLSTRDIANLLVSFLVIGTVFTMLTGTDPDWWERNFSQLGVGTGAWAFNGTVIIAGLLVATIGLYIGRDLHRLLDDDALRHIAIVVIVWVAAGGTLVAVGGMPTDQLPIAHTIAAFTTLVLFVAAAALTTAALSHPPAVLRTVTVMVVLLIIMCTGLTLFVPGLSFTALESIVVGLVLLWLTTVIRVLNILVPNVSKTSQRSRLRRMHR
ncbi:MAG TPA: DUF998 domain-containing protein [Candidatus Yaniella excrementigallinarum]|nr:DUF998 domain-containing protein [Candidatus Yaniella excrementigallinarum]